VADFYKPCKRNFAKLKGPSAQSSISQTCAAEKNVVTQAGLFPDPNQARVINTDVCEGWWGLCVQFELRVLSCPRNRTGTQRAIDQSLPSKDFSLREWLLPSFVTT